MRRHFQEHSAAFIGWRFYFLLSFITLIVLCLVVRLFYLSVFNRHFLQQQGDARALRILYTPSFRGMIKDRTGYPLAISTEVYSVWMNPQEISLSSSSIKSLTDILKIKKSDLQKTLQKYQNHEFAYLKREVSPQVAKEIKALKIPGLYLQQTYKRFYPEAQVTAHVIGFTNVDDEGQEGLELIYNDWLKGTFGKKIVLKDRLGRVISEVKQLKQQEPGQDLQLSIHRRIQYLAYRELLEGIHNSLASSGSVVVLDVKTGEVLAMVNYPSFNPNNRHGLKSDMLRNRAVTDLFEPGSTIKAFSVALALKSGQYSPDTVIDTYPGWLRVGRHLLRDEHRKGPMTIRQILQYSSNVGIAKMISTLPPLQLWELLHAMGFGEETGIGFPGERGGALIKRENWPPFALATLAIGYGISVTPLQLAHAYATLANQGVKIPLSLLKVEKPPLGQQVLDPAIARETLSMLESVVEKGGTAQSAAIHGFKVAGKTGTSKLVGEHGYEKHRYNAMFVGIAPASNPRLVIAVLLHDPRGKQYYGGDVSAPVFKNIMEGSLRILNIQPDDLPPTESVSL